MEKDRVQFTPLNESNFQVYQAISIPAYAQRHVETGRWLPSEALQNAREEFKELLPAGLATKEMSLFSIEDADSGAKVGVIWFGVRTSGLRKDAYLYDFLIFEEFRRQGYGLQALLVLEEQVKALDLHEIHLHVFGHNLPARALYEKVGYRTTDLLMAKKLNSHEE